MEGCPLTQIGVTSSSRVGDVNIACDQRKNKCTSGKTKQNAAVGQLPEHTISQDPAVTFRVGGGCCGGGRGGVGGVEPLSVVISSPLNVPVLGALSPISLFLWGGGIRT